MKLRSLAPMGLLVLGLGCSGPATPEAKTALPSESPKDGGTPAPSAPLVVPDPLKNAAYQYYGLSLTKPLDMEVRSSSQPGMIMSGAQTVTLTGVEPSKATYKIERSGNLGSALGNMEVTLEPDGIYVKSSDVAKVGSHDLEFPNTITPGYKWSSKTVVEQAGKQMDITNEFKILGVQKLKSKTGLVEALVIVSTGNGKILGKSVRMESKSWYVKGTGNVKAEMKTVDGKGKTESVSIVAAGY